MWNSAYCKCWIRCWCLTGKRLLQLSGWDLFCHDLTLNQMFILRKVSEVVVYYFINFWRREKGGAWEGTELVQCFYIRNPCYWNVWGKAGTDFTMLIFVQGLLQAFTESFRDWVFLGSKTTVDCMTKASLHLNASCSNYFSASKRKNVSFLLYPFRSRDGHCGRLQLGASRVGWWSIPPAFMHP